MLFSVNQMCERRVGVVSLALLLGVGVFIVFPAQSLADKYQGIVIRQDGERHINVQVDSELIPAVKILRKPGKLQIKLPHTSFPNGFKPGTLRVDSASKSHIRVSQESLETTITVTGEPVFLSIQDLERPSGVTSSRAVSIPVKAKPVYRSAAVKAKVHPVKPRASRKPIKTRTPVMSTPRKIRRRAAKTNATSLSHVTSRNTTSQSTRAVGVTGVTAAVVPAVVSQTPSKQTSGRLDSAVLPAVGAKAQRLDAPVSVNVNVPSETSAKALEGHDALDFSDFGESVTPSEHKQEGVLNGVDALESADTGLAAQSAQSDPSSLPSEVPEAQALSTLFQGEERGSVSDSSMWRMVLSLFAVLGLLFLFLKSGLPWLMGRFPSFFTNKKRDYEQKVNVGGSVKVPNLSLDGFEPSQPTGLFAPPALRNIEKSEVVSVRESKAKADHELFKPEPDFSAAIPALASRRAVEKQSLTRIKKATDINTVAERVSLELEEDAFFERRSRVREHSSVSQQAETFGEESGANLVPEKTAVLSSQLFPAIPAERRAQYEAQIRKLNRAMVLRTTQELAGDQQLHHVVLGGRHMVVMTHANKASMVALINADRSLEPLSAASEVNQNDLSFFVIRLNLLQSMCTSDEPASVLMKTVPSTLSEHLRADELSDIAESLESAEDESPSTVNVSTLYEKYLPRDAERASARVAVSPSPSLEPVAEAKPFRSAEAEDDVGRMTPQEKATRESSALSSPQHFDAVLDAVVEEERLNGQMYGDDILLPLISDPYVQAKSLPEPAVSPAYPVKSPQEALESDELTYKPIRYVNASAQSDKAAFFSDYNDTY